MENHLNNSFRLPDEWSALCRYEAEAHNAAMETAKLPNNIRKNRDADSLPCKDAVFCLGDNAHSNTDQQLVYCHLSVNSHSKYKINMLKS